MSTSLATKLPITSAISFAANASQALDVDSDLSLSATHAKDYPIRVWYYIASFIALVSLCHLFNLFLIRIFPSTRQTRRINAQQPTTFQLHRLPQASADTFRAILFRSAIQIGSSYTLNIAELLLSIAGEDFYRNWRPGQSAYLRILIPGSSAEASSESWWVRWRSPIALLESHPFTIASIEHSDNTANICGSSHNTHASKADAKKLEKKSEANTETDSSNSSRQTKLMFVIRARSGMTKHLMDVSLQAREQQMNVKVILDGPYGSPPRLRGFDTVVLIAGGSGITFTLPLFLDVVRNAKEDTTDPCQKLTFIWVIRDINILAILTDLLPSLSDAPSTLSISILIFVTESKPEDARSLDQEAKTGTIPNTEMPSIPGVEIMKGRPHLEQMIENEIAQAKTTGTGNAISFNGSRHVPKNPTGKTGRVEPVA
ncbi:hypothetical protein H0H92_004433 [Tricholoma furcatifolium]|nr:hypothetical protein H0H92_004433 [Tricholoma furcatifolium]